MSRLNALILLILLANFQVAFSCSEGYLEQVISTRQGVDGNCYYKRIPQPDNVRSWQWDSLTQDAWRTEFYLTNNSREPLFIEPGWFSENILCAVDDTGQAVIARVEYTFRKDDFDQEVFDPTGRRSNWLRFYVNQEEVAAYTPLELIRRDANFYYPVGACDIEFIERRTSFLKDPDTGRYVIGLKMLDHFLMSFDVLTGAHIPVEQVPEVALREAVHAGDYAKVNNLLEKGVNPNSGSWTEGTPLNIAAANSHLPIAALLIKYGAKLEYSHQAMVWTCDSENICGQKEGISWAFVDPKTGHSVPHHPLYIAATLADRPMLDLLLNKGLDVNAKGDLFSHHFDYAIEGAVAKGHNRTVAYLLERGALPTFVSLERAIRNLDLPITKQLLDNGVDLNAVNTDDDTIFDILDNMLENVHVWGDSQHLLNQIKEMLLSHQRQTY